MITVMRAPIVLSAVFSILSAASAAAPALADTIYKWVDDQGKVHYSNSAPADASRHAEVVSQDRISVVQSDPPAVRAAAAARAESEYLARRIDNLERELVAQRNAAAAQDRAMQAAYDDCVSQRRTDCGNGAAGYGAPFVIAGAPFIAGASVVPGRFPVRRARIRNLNGGFTGVTAGNLVTFGPARGRSR